jgi:hypothetical protein
LALLLGGVLVGARQRPFQGRLDLCCWCSSGFPYSPEISSVVPGYLQIAYAQVMKEI